MPAFCLTTPDEIAFYRLLALRGALRLEVLGLRHSSGKSVYALVKRELGFKGSKGVVLDLLTTRIEAIKAAKHAANVTARQAAEDDKLLRDLFDQNEIEDCE